jgi:hypothetical protein
VEFRPASGGAASLVKADVATGAFRAWLPQGRYTATQGGHKTLLLLPGGTYSLDLRQARVLDFHAYYQTGSDGALTLRVSADGAGSHTFAARAFNLDVPQPEEAAQLESGKSVALVWQAAIKADDTPWIAVVIPDGDLSQRQELTGTSPM